MNGTAPDSPLLKQVLRNPNRAKNRKRGSHEVRWRPTRRCQRICVDTNALWESRTQGKRPERAGRESSVKRRGVSNRPTSKREDKSGT